MTTLSTENRRLLERTIVDARALAERAAGAALEALAVGRAKPDGHMSDEQKAVRNHLRARARQLGDGYLTTEARKRDFTAEAQSTQRREDDDSQLRDLRASAVKTPSMSIEHLVQECAYEHWHRMLFARFLAENKLLIEPDAGVAISLDECKELAKEEKTDLWTLAGRYAQRMLPQIFRADDPVLKVRLAREDELKLEGLVDRLPVDVFTATDSLGWCYQFWQTDEKKRVNESETKIGADELPAVTQLFTEDYMVDFLLDNTLGAWWAGKMLNRRDAENAKSEEELRRKIALPGCEWKYLRFVKDEKTGWRPAAGTFDGWPKTVKELKCMDPCCGSGHFLVAMFDRLAALRMAAEGLNKRKAAEAVVRDNIFGLEIDPRCTQIAAFNLALAAWRFAGGHLTAEAQRTQRGESSELSDLRASAVNIACCGLAPNCTKEQWLALAEDAAARAGMPAKRDLFGAEDSLLSAPVRGTLTALYDLFSQAPVLGSLINPRDLPHDLFHADYRSVAPLLAAVLKSHDGGDDTRERAIAAAGMAKAAELLEETYDLVATNVPYLARGKQNETLRELAERRYPESKNDLATVFLERCLTLCVTEGNTALVLPQNWLFLTSYRKLREKLLKNEAWRLVVRLGPQGFQTPMWDFNVQLLTLSRTKPPARQALAGLDVSHLRAAHEKAAALLTAEIKQVEQAKQLENPDARVALEMAQAGVLLENYADALNGMHGGDSLRYRLCFWEVYPGSIWCFFQSTHDKTDHFGGREHVFYWAEDGHCHRTNPKAFVKGEKVWGRTGVVVSMMRSLPVTLFTGEKFDISCTPIIPHNPAHLPAIWCYCSSPEYNAAVRRIDQKLNVTNATLVKVPFDLDRWQKVAAEKYPNGLPAPYSSDPTQWTFDGQPAGSEHPLQVAVARLLGYRWPAETGDFTAEAQRTQRTENHDSKLRALRASAVNPSPALCDPSASAVNLSSFADDDGIVCIPSVRGEPGAADRLLRLLTAADIKPDRDLDEWLRNSFFEEHCTLFHDRPFIWHIWDGRKRDGFHALVNYHKLCGSGFQPLGIQRQDAAATFSRNHSGRRLLEKLTHAYLGDWITRQRADVKDEKEGAEERLAAALALKERLEAIIEGEPPFDIFVRWKPLAKQPIGWEPDSNDGVRMNIRPFMVSDLPGGKKGAGVLRAKPNTKWEKDRGKEPNRPKAEFPWFWEKSEFTGNRVNDVHLTNDEKARARERFTAEGAEGRRG